MIINDDVGVGALLLHLTNTHCSKFMFVRFDFLNKPAFAAMHGPHSLVRFGD